MRGQPATAATCGDGPRRGGGFGRQLLWIAAVAVLLRLAILILAEHRPERFDFPDSHRYMLVARNIAAGLGPIESQRVRAGTDPLYPYILSAGVRLGFVKPSELMRFGRVVNSLFSLASVVLLALFARRLFGRRPAVIAAAILAVDPILLFFNGLVLTETPYIALLLAGFCCLGRLGEAGDESEGARETGDDGISPANALAEGPVQDRHTLALIAWAAGAGVLLGLATSLRSSGLLLPILIVPFLWHYTIRSRRGPLAAAVVAVFLAGAVLPLAPVAARNWRLLGHFVPVCSNGGASLLDGLGPWADGATGMDRIAYPAFPPDADECERDRLCRAAALGWAREHPVEALGLAWVKLRRTWSVTINAADYSSASYTVVAWATVAPEFLLAFLGGLRLVRHRFGVLALLLLPGVYFTLMHMVFVGSVRYRLPAMPFLFVLAGVAVDGILLRLGRNGERWSIRGEAGSRRAS